MSMFVANESHSLISFSTTLSQTMMLIMTASPTTTKRSLNISTLRFARRTKKKLRYFLPARMTTHLTRMRPKDKSSSLPTHLFWTLRSLVLWTLLFPSPLLRSPLLLSPLPTLALMASWACTLPLPYSVFALLSSFLSLHFARMSYFLTARTYPHLDNLSFAFHAYFLSPLLSFS